MSDPNNNVSFIPKRGSSKTENSAPRRIFAGAIVARIIFFSTILATIITFFYDRQVRNELAAEINNFQSTAGAFNADTERLEEILAFDARLKKAAELREQTFSVNTLMTAIERAVIRPVQFNNLELVRESSGEIELTADVFTDSFDSVLFQRSVLNDSEVLRMARIERVQVSFSETDTTNMQFSQGQNTGKEGINFTVQIIVDPKTIPALAETSVGFRPMTQPSVPAVPELPTEPENLDLINNQEVPMGNDSGAEAGLVDNIVVE